METLTARGKGILRRLEGEAVAAATEGEPEGSSDEDLLEGSVRDAARPRRARAAREHAVDDDVRGDDE